MPSWQKCQKLSGLVDRENLKSSFLERTWHPHYFISPVNKIGYVLLVNMGNRLDQPPNRNHGKAFVLTLKAKFHLSGGGDHETVDFIAGRQVRVCLWSRRPCIASDSEPLRGFAAGLTNTVWTMPRISETSFYGVCRLGHTVIIRKIDFKEWWAMGGRNGNLKLKGFPISRKAL